MASALAPSAVVGPPRLSLTMNGLRELRANPHATIIAMNDSCRRICMLRGACTLPVVGVSCRIIVGTRPLASKTQRGYAASDIKEIRNHNNTWDCNKNSIPNRYVCVTQSKVDVVTNISTDDNCFHRRA